MGKLKLIEIVVLAAAAFFAALKSIIKSIDYMHKFKEKRAECAA